MGISLWMYLLKRSRQSQCVFCRQVESVSRMFSRMRVAGDCHLCQPSQTMTDFSYIIFLSLLLRSCLFKLPSAALL